jgi:hypothetical protein
MQCKEGEKELAQNRTVASQTLWRREGLERKPTDVGYCRYGNSGVTVFKFKMKEKKTHMHCPFYSSISVLASRAVASCLSSADVAEGPEWSHWLLSLIPLGSCGQGGSCSFVHCEPVAELWTQSLPVNLCPHLAFVTNWPVVLVLGESLEVSS